MLYVGKAKNLRARLSNYFAPLHTLHERTRRMVTTAASVEWTVVATDVDSLQLEYQWIKEFDPPFNVRYKDDKSYPFMAITLADEAPRVIVTRNRRIPGAKYFGPYPKVWAVHDTIDLMIKVFPIRTCSDASYKKAMATGRPCFPGQIGRCGGPCSMKVTIEEHRAIVDDFIAFMSGGDQRFTKELTARMREASAAMDYEAAAVYRDRLQAIDAVLNKSALVLAPDTDADLFGIAEDELAATVQHFVIRGGRVRGVRATTIEKELDISGGDLVDQVLQRTYGDAAAADIPRQVLVPALPDDAAELEEWLRERGGARRHDPGRPARAQGRPHADRDAQRAAGAHAPQDPPHQRLRRAHARRSPTCRRRSTSPRRRCASSASTSRTSSGTNVVASMVVFEDGLPRKDQYRSFGVPETTDDTDSLYQVLTRRLAYVDRPERGRDARRSARRRRAASDDDASSTERKRPRFAYRPQLLVVDGGKPQVEAAARALARRRPRGDRPVRHREAARGGVAAGRGVPGHPAAHLEALYLLQRLRDEAHRFAITHQRKRRRRDIQSVLAEVPGLGDARIKALLRHFGSVAALQAGDARGDRGAAGRRAEARGSDPRPPGGVGSAPVGRLGSTGVVMTDEATRTTSAKC